MPGIEVLEFESGVILQLFLSATNLVFYLLQRAHTAASFLCLPGTVGKSLLNYRQVCLSESWGISVDLNSALELTVNKQLSSLAVLIPEGAVSLIFLTSVCNHRCDVSVVSAREINKPWTCLVR